MIKDIIETGNFRSDIHHSQYREFYITSKETLSFGIDEINPYSEMENKFGLRIENINIDTLRILKQVYTDSYASCIYEFKIPEKENILRKVNVISVMTLTKSGWLILSSTIAIDI